MACPARVTSQVYGFDLRNVVRSPRSMSASAYDSYGTWKSWSAANFLKYSEDDQRYYDGEMASHPLRGTRVLELGFGNGSFLGYARDRGATIAGTEVSNEAIARAHRAAIRVYAADLVDAVAEGARFDLVVAFDVFEHLSREELASLFTRLEALTPPGAQVVARFPNGQSPLGRVHQYGDATHRLVLSPGMLPQIVGHRGWRIARVSNPFVVVDGSLARRAVQSARRGFRTALERGVNALYGLDITLDPNVVVVMERSAAPPENEQRAHD